MSEGLDIVFVGILGVFGNLLVLMVLMGFLGRIVKEMERTRESSDNTSGEEVA